MPAVDPGVVGQGHELYHVVVHVRSRAFEQATAPGDEQRITREDGLFCGEVQRNMPAGVARNEKDATFKPADPHAVSFIHEIGNARSAVAIAFMPVHLEAGELPHEL